MTISLFPDLDPETLARRQLEADLVRADALVSAGALVVISTSGGKDSQAMIIKLAQRWGSGSLVAVTADLGEMEWEDAVEHARAQAEAVGITHHAVKPLRSLLAGIRLRGKWPASKIRFCTSDHKRGPIYKFIRAQSKTGVVINATGERWGENPHEGQARCSRPACRCKRIGLEVNKTLTMKRPGGRQVFNLRPILDLSTAEVFQTIAAAGQEPHRLYAEGLTRFSCSFCVFGRRSDLALAKKHRPALLKKLIKLETEMGHSFRHGFSLAEL